MDALYKIYHSLSGSIKRVKIFEGQHADQRPFELQQDMIQFVISIFKKQIRSPGKPMPDNKRKVFVL